MNDAAKVMTFLATTDRARAKTFYAETLGLTFVVDEPCALVLDISGAMLRISPVPSFTPQPFTVLGWEVPDIAAEISALVGKGIAFERYSFMEHDADGVVTFDNGDKVAWFKDPDGNLLSLTQF